MSVGSLKNGTMSLLTQKLAQGKQAPAHRAADSKDDALATTHRSGEMSKLGEAMKQLSSLANSDPAKFKSLTAEISQGLKSLSQSETGDEAHFIDELATKFEQASASGNLSSLQPPVPGPRIQPGAAAYAQHRPNMNDDAPQLRSKISAILSQALG